MGGRGARLNPRGSKKDIATTAQDATGATIDLSDSPLEYGAKDPAMTPNVRKAIEEFEDKKWKRKIEYARVVDKNGNILQESKGGHSSVRIKYNALARSSAYTHNHPREAGELGGTFSVADLKLFVDPITKATTHRATASEGTYSITKTGNFNASGLIKYFTAEEARHRKSYEQVTDKLHNQAMANTITYQEYKIQAAKAFNAFLVNLHNSLLAGRQAYGYTYTLERREEK